jgi:serine/threonine-protein kinase HipA
MSVVDALEVHVELAGETTLAGRAQFQRRHGRLSATTFQYETSFLADPFSYEIDPAFRLVSGTQYVPGIPGTFGDSAPDRWGRNLIDKRERAVAREDMRAPRSLDDADYLIGVSDVTRQGALRFRATPDSPFLHSGDEVPRLIRLPALLRAADDVGADPANESLPAVKTLLDAGTGSLGGARPKASVLGDDGKALIAKFPHHSDDWDVMLWEATALDLAAAAGVTTPSHELVSIDGRHVLLVERFDRDISPAGRPLRHGYMSAMSLLERRDGEGGDYSEIAERLSEISSRSTADAHELFRRVALSVAVNNTDDHLRNHGFIRRSGGWSLSPAFDINPNPEIVARQTSILGSDRPSTAADALGALAPECRLTGPEARAVIDEVVDAVAGWRRVAARNGASAAEMNRFERVFDIGLEAVRAAR